MSSYQISKARSNCKV